MGVGMFKFISANGVGFLAFAAANLFSWLFIIQLQGILAVSVIATFLLLKTPWIFRFDCCRGFVPTSAINVFPQKGRHLKKSSGEISGCSRSNLLPRCGGAELQEKTTGPSPALNLFENTYRFGIRVWRGRYYSHDV